MKKEQAQKELDLLRKEFNERADKLQKIIEAPEKNGRWKPEVMKRYYFLTEDGYINSIIYGNGKDSNFRIATGNCFKTEEEAQEYKEKLIFIQEVKDYIAEQNGDWEYEEGNSYWQLKYNTDDLEIESAQGFYIYCSKDKMCATKEIAQSVIDKFDNKKLKEWFI